MRVKYVYQLPIYSRYREEKVPLTKRIPWTGITLFILLSLLYLECGKILIQ
jgi:hypothetical protein